MTAQAAKANATAEQAGQHAVELLAQLHFGLVVLLDAYRERIAEAGLPGLPVDLFAYAADEAGVEINDDFSHRLRLLSQSTEARKKRRQRDQVAGIIGEEKCPGLGGKNVPIERVINTTPYPQKPTGSPSPDIGARQPLFGQDQAGQEETGAGAGVLPFAAWRRTRPSVPVEVPDLPMVDQEWISRRDLLNRVAASHGLPEASARDLSAWQEALKRFNLPWPSETDVERLEHAALRTVANFDHIGQPWAYWATCFCDPFKRIQGKPPKAQSAPPDKNGPAQEQEKARAPRLAPVDAAPPEGFAPDAWKALIRCVARNQYRKHPQVEASFAAAWIAENFPPELWRGPGVLASAVDSFAAGPDWAGVCGVSGSMPWHRMQLGRHLKAARVKLGIAEPEPLATPQSAALRRPESAKVEASCAPVQIMSALPGEEPGATFARIQGGLGPLQCAAFDGLVGEVLSVRLPSGIARHLANPTNIFRRTAEQSLTRAFGRRIRLDVREIAAEAA